MKSTKKALLLSITSMILCIAMLMGTTFAWFTDTVTSGANKIVAGNLDVELYHASKNVAKTKVTEATTNLFKDVAHWEPGAYAYETFTVANEGSLALKFKMALNVLAFTSYNGHNLTEVIKVATAETAPATREAAAALSYTALKDWSLSDYSTDNALAPNAEKTFTVVLYWEPTDHDNDFNMNNGRPQPLSIDLGVTLVATQETAENDSFDDQFDKDASNTLPEATKYEAKLAEAKSAKTAVNATGDTAIKAAATPTTSTVAERQDTTVTFPEGALTANKDAVLSVKTTNTLFAVTSAGAQVASVDLNLTVDGQPVANFNDKTVTVETYISAGLANVGVSYNGEGEQPTFVSYDPATGKLTFKTTHFSEYTVTGKAIAYILGEKDTGFEGYDVAAEAAKTQDVELTKDADMQAASVAAEAKGSAFVIPTQTVQNIEKTGDEGKKVQENFAARIGTKYFSSLAQAISIVKDNETIAVLKDVALTEKLVISNGKTFTLDLGGKTVTGRVNVSGAKVTIKNGTINAGSMSQALNAYGTNDSAYNTTNDLFTYIKVEKDVTLLGDYGMCFLSDITNTYNGLCYGVKVDFYGTSKCYCAAFVSGNIGAIDDGRGGTPMHTESIGPVFNVYGTLKGSGDGSEDSSQGISLNGYITVNVYDGAEISGSEAVGLKAGRLNVYGGSLTATGIKYDPVLGISSGTDASGAAIAITSTYSAGTGKMIANIMGGKITSANNAAILVAHASNKAFVNGVELNISGGTFFGASDLGGVYVEPALEGEEGKYPTKFITGGTFDKDPSQYVAECAEVVQNETVFNVSILSLDSITGKWKDVADETGIHVIDKKVIEISTAEGLAYFAKSVSEHSGIPSHPEDDGSYNGYTVKLANDIDLGGKLWTPINMWYNDVSYILTIDGQGHTIKNMSIKEKDQAVGFFGITAGELIVKDLTFKNPMMETEHCDGSKGTQMGALIGSQYGNVTVTNVDVMNGYIHGMMFAFEDAQKSIRIGGLVGQAQLHDGPSQLRLTGCDVEGVDFWGYHNTCGLVGSLMNYTTKTEQWEISNCSVMNCNFKIGTVNTQHVSPITVDGATFPTRETNDVYFASMVETNNNSFAYNQKH